MLDWNLYDYKLPEKLVVKQPAVPRDTSRLLIYNTESDQIFFDRFFHLERYLPAKSKLILNNTKVLAAKVILRKQNGGKVVCLLLLNELVQSEKNNLLKTLVDRKIKVGDYLILDPKHRFKVIRQVEKIFYLQFDFDRQWLFDKIAKVGKTPVPLYLRKTPLSDRQLRKKYQTIFAKFNGTHSAENPGTGSVAAPTASLHFSKRVFAKLEKKGVNRHFVTLHVGLGTFAPIGEKNIIKKRLHEEYYELDSQEFNRLREFKSEGYKLIAAGTTTVRTLESAALIQPEAKGKNPDFPRKTDLFIFPPFEFKLVDILLTNFHLPKSSLMMLVEAFLQHKKAKKHLIELYKIAVREKFRFYSFGDAMLII